METDSSCEPPADVRSAFEGDAPLLSALPFFNSHEELLKAYAVHQGVKYAFAAGRFGQCDVCGRSSSIENWAVLGWRARIRWMKREAAFKALLMLLLAYFDPFSLIRWLPGEEYAGFVTYHGLCAPCLRRLRRRRWYFSSLMVMISVLGIGLGIGMLVAGCMIVLGVFGWQRFNGGDAVRALPYFVVLLFLAVAILPTLRYVENLLHFPGTLSKIVKKPFWCEESELRTAETVFNPLDY